MTSLTQLKRKAEQISGVRASIEYDDAYGPHVQISADSEVPLDTLDEICEETDSVMKVEGQNPFGEYEYLFR